MALANEWPLPAAIKKPRRSCLTGFLAEGSVHYLRNGKVELQTKKVIGNRPVSEVAFALESIVRIHEYRLHAITLSTFRICRIARSYQSERRTQVSC